MPTKKKHKPRFDVPEVIDTAPQSGWVYRSDEARPTAARSNGALIEGLAVSMAYGLATAGHLFVIGTRVIAMPFTMGLRLIGRR